MVATAVTVMLLASAMGALTFISRSLDNSQKSANSFALQSVALDYVARDIRSSRGVIIDQSGNRLQLRLPKEYEDRVVYSSPQSVSTEGVTYAGGNVLVTYTFANGQLTRTNSQGASQQVIPASFATAVRFSPSSLITIGAPVPPVKITLITLPAPGQGITGASLATNTMDLTVQPNVTTQVFDPAIL